VSSRIKLRPEAEAEIREANTWYEEHSPGLGRAYLDEVARVLEVIAASPDHYPLAESPIRKAVLQRFPYIILYRAQDDEIVVVSCFHTRRNPTEWRTRP